MSAADAPVLLQRQGSVARVLLNRPDAGNAIDRGLASALRDAAIECDEDATVRCVVIAARGKMFCAGGDIRAFARAGDQVGVLIKQITADLHIALSRLMRMNKPLVTAIQGPAAGAGLSLAVLGDLALAARSAHFTMAYTALGVSPDGGSTWILPRLIGLRRTQELALLNERVSSDAAVSMGLITRVVDDDVLDAEVSALSGRLGISATMALGRTRNLLLSSFGAGFEEQMELESRSIAACSIGVEGREGIRAFGEKRKPDWSE